MNHDVSRHNSLKQFSFPESYDLLNRSPFDIEESSPKNEYTEKCFPRNDQCLDLLDCLRSEYEILGSISSPFIQKYINTILDKNIIIQTVESEKVNLLQYYRGDYPLTEKVAAHVFADLLQAVDYLHVHNIVHFDIRPENIFIVNGCFKLGGFFKDKYVNDYNMDSVQYGTLNYQAPEIFDSMKSQNVDGKKADVWACGVFLCAILTGKLPFLYDSNQKACDESEKCDDSEFTYMEIKKQVCTLDNIQIPTYISREARDLLVKILNKNPLERPNISELLKNEWFNKLRITPDEILPKPYNY